jgi:hypothetical protein
VTEVLERLGHTVEFPLAQTCCGQMHYNTGYQAKRFRWCGGLWRCSRRRGGVRAFRFLRGDDARALRADREE